MRAFGSLRLLCSLLVYLLIAWLLGVVFLVDCAGFMFVVCVIVLLDCLDCAAVLLPGGFGFIQVC